MGGERGGPTKVVAFRLPLDYAKRLEQIAAARGTQVGPMLAKMVTRRIDEIEGGGHDDEVV